MNKFEALGITQKLAKKLEVNGILNPTPIQLEAIPIILQGRDVLGLAQTGTGKTAAFGLPLIQNLAKEGSAPKSKEVKSLILAPTRELAKQITDALKSFQGDGHLKINMVVGGLSINPQKERLARGSDILVATPGRLIDLLGQGSLTLSKTSYLVLDEADQMLDMGFIKPLEQISKLITSERQTLLFSATMPALMEQLAAAFLKNPRKVQVSVSGKTVDKVVQKICFIAKSEKSNFLLEHLSAHQDCLALVFVRTKSGAEKLLKFLDRKKLSVASIHGNKSQNQRDRALSLFKNGKVKTLVATDVAARGIDIPDVSFVYNFDLPNVPENYIHRIGRTARAGKSGTAITLCASDEMAMLKGIEKLMKQEISVESGIRWIVSTEKGSKSKKPEGKKTFKKNFKRSGPKRNKSQSSRKKTQ
mgnify:FL=1